MFDLDELERKARAAKANSPVWCGPPADTWSRDRALINFEHIRANSPDVTIKLIARIRELEDSLRDCADTLDGEDVDPDGEMADGYRSVIAKGVP